MALTLQSMSGTDGQIELAGVRAVIGIFLRWTLKRRGETPSGAPSWTLRADFSYQKDSMLNSSQKKVIKIKLPSKDGSWYEAQPLEGCVMKIQEGRMTIEGVTLCPVEQRK